MLTVLYQLQALKWVPAGFFLLGSSANYLSMWGVWRLMSCLLPTRVYERGDECLYNFYQKLVLFFYENYTGVQIILYGDADKMMKQKENVILMCNHQSTVDWIVADMLAERQGTLGNVRYILKDGLKYFPVYGFSLSQHGCVYVKRSGFFNDKRAAEQLRMFLSNKTPFWMVVFPEGTRFNPDLPGIISKSKSHAESNGLVPLDHVLTPRVKAMQLCIQQLREATDAVYDVTIAYSNTTDPDSGHRTSSPGLPDFLNGICKQLHIRVDRILTEDVPCDPKTIGTWLHQRFLEKDKLLSRFYSADPAVAGKLGETGRIHDLGLRYTLPAFLLWTAINTPLWATSTGRSVYWKASLAGITAGIFWMSIRS